MLRLISRVLIAIDFKRENKENEREPKQKMNRMKQPIVGMKKYSMSDSLANWLQHNERKMHSAQHKRKILPQRNQQMKAMKKKNQE